MPSLASRAMPVLLRLHRSKAYYRSRDATLAHIAALQVRPGSWAPPVKLDRLVDIAVRTHQGWPVYEVTPKNRQPTGRCVYGHGGAWIHEITARQWALVAGLAASTGIAFTVPIYPLAPTGTAGAVVPAMADLVAAVIDEAGAQRTTLLGDSAGGTIVLAAAMLLRDRGLPQPRRIVLISPALDLSFTDPAMVALAEIDPWLDIPGPRAAADLWRGPLAVDDPLVSPMQGELAGLPPITLYSGTRDVMHADALRFVALARAAGHLLDYTQAAEMLHDYPLLPTPEGKRARAAIAAVLLN